MQEFVLKNKFLTASTIIIIHLSFMNWLTSYDQNFTAWKSYIGEGFLNFDYSIFLLLFNLIFFLRYVEFYQEESFRVYKVILHLIAFSFFAYIIYSALLSGGILLPAFYITLVLFIIQFFSDIKTKRPFSRFP